MTLVRVLGTVIEVDPDAELLFAAGLDSLESLAREGDSFALEVRVVNVREDGSVVVAPVGPVPEEWIGP